jgi:hypothetical protein
MKLIFFGFFFNRIKTGFSIDTVVTVPELLNRTLRFAGGYLGTSG